MLHTVQPFLSQPSLPRSVPGHFGTWGVLQRQYPEADLWHWGGQLWWHLGGSTNFNLVASPRSVYLGVSINGDTGIPLNHPFYINNFNEGFLYKPSSIRPIHLVHPRQQWYATAVRGTTGKVNLKAVNHPWFAKLSTKHIIRYFFWLVHEPCVLTESVTRENRPGLFCGSMELGNAVEVANGYNHITMVCLTPWSWWDIALITMVMQEGDPNWPCWKTWLALDRLEPKEKQISAP